MQTTQDYLLALIILGVAAVSVSPTVAQKNYSPGVTDTEIKIGQTMPYSGAASAWVQSAGQSSLISR